MSLLSRHVLLAIAVTAVAAQLFFAPMSVAETRCSEAEHETAGLPTEPPIPHYLQSFRDPQYGGKVTLISDAPGRPVLGVPGMEWPSVARHQYSAHQPWNADGSLLYLGRGDIFIDGNTYKPLQLPNVPKGFWNWSPTEPDTMIIPTAHGIGRWDVRLGEWLDSVRIPGYSQFRSQTRDNPSYDGKRFAVKALRDSDGVPVCIGVDLETNVIGPIIDFDAYGFSLGKYNEGKARRCGVTPSGQFIALNGHANGSYNDQAHFFDWSTGALVYRQRENAGVECPGGHGDLGLSEDGNDVFVGICKRRGKLWSWRFGNRTVALRIPDGEIWALAKGSASHTSCRNSRRPGHCYGSSYGEGATINAKSIDGKRVELLLDPRNRREKYLDETHAVPSPDGKKILFVSRWNDSFPDGRRLFVLEPGSHDESEDCAGSMTE